MKKFTTILCSCLIAAGLSATDVKWSEVAFLSHHTDLTDFRTNADDDEIAAGNWFITKGGVFVSLTDIANETTDLTDFEAIWIHLDRIIETGDPVDDFVNIHLAPYTDADVLDAIKTFYENGGNLLLTTHASHYLIDLGRFHIRPEVNGFGAGSSNDDTWFANAALGTWTATPQVFDHTGDPLFEGLTYEMQIRDNGLEYKQFPLIGSGSKEDHNCLWNMDYVSANDNPDKYNELYTAYQLTPLAMWPHIQDYYGGAVIRWDANDDYLGKCITIGLAAYEWNQNSGANTYQSNIEQLTENALAELAPDNGTPNAINNISQSNLKITLSNDILTVAGEDYTGINIYAASGLSAGKYTQTQGFAGIGMEKYPSGIYVVQIVNEGKTVAMQKICK